MSKRWDNPYSSLRSNSTKTDLATENYRKVQKRKAEQMFLSGIRSNYNLEHLNELEDELETREVAAPVRQIKHQPQTRAVKTVEPADAYRWTQEITGHVRAMEVTHHGATLWCAENDGSVTVRSGGNGLVVFSIQPNEGITVDALYATETHMWLGLSDGTVQVYDHLVYIHVTEGRFHDDRVTSFVETFDGRVFSASADGSLVKWDNESRNFEAITKIIPGQKDATSLATFGYKIFSASSDGTISALDTESGQKFADFAPMMHDSPITTLAVFEDALFSGDESGSFRVWNTENGAMLSDELFESGIVSAVVDKVTRRVWLALADGEIKVIRAGAASGFAVEQTITSHKGRPIVSLKGYCAVDSVRLWTFASNGVNKIWCSSKNMVEQGIVSTTDALKGVIAQDTIELDKWRGLVSRLENVDQRRKHQLAEALRINHLDKLRRRYVHVWREVIHRRHRDRRSIMISDRLAAEEEVLFTRRFFSKWFRWYRHSQNVRLRSKFSEVLEQTTKKSIVLSYFRKMQVFSRTIKNTMQRQDLINVLGLQNSHFLTRIYMRKWLKFRNIRSTMTRRIRYAEQLMRVSDDGLVRLYYQRWFEVLKHKKALEEKHRFGESLLQMTASGSRREAFRKWLKFAQSKYHRQRIDKAAAILLLNSNNGLMASCYAKWKAFRAVKMAEKQRSKNDTAVSELNEMKDKYAALEQLMAEKREIEKLKQQLEQHNQDLQDRQLKLNHLQSERDQLSADLVQKQAEDSERVASIQEQLENLMAKLKAKVINLYADQQLFHQVREKLKQGQPVTKIFLEAHQSVKRVVVELTKRPHLGVQEHWPLTPEQLRRMPTHHTSVVLSAIKAMIVTFDVMDKETRDSITTDQEIVVNADWLMMMAEQCAANRKKLIK